NKSPPNPRPGALPLLEPFPIGCRLGPRCPYAQRECIETPRLTGARNHLYACPYPLNMEQAGKGGTMFGVCATTEYLS
ncbi:hypothetical protein M8371_33425, partial [Klebsiella pneumoniae]|nr:hypothetical protein [Klebsiella pneumoniae]